jgi:exodeoxyribonuclease V beta subunit
MEPCGELLPKGVETGNLLHHVLETLPFEWLAAYPSQEALEKNETDFSKLNTFLQRALRRYALSTEYLKALRNIVWNTLKTFLPAPHPFTLSDLKHRKHEMEFVLAVQPHLKTVLRLDLEEPVEFRFDMNAFFLRGFVDMIFEYEEKYYIVDWKSNHLGDSPEEYTQSRILESIREQRYFLQYSLYTTALCFFLKKQNPQFSFEKNFGGVYYLYLRGMKENASTGIFFHKPKPEELHRFTESFLKQRCPCW